MKSFVFKLSILALLCTLVLMGIYHYNRSVVQKASSLLKEHTVLIFGDSYLEKGLIPEVFTSAVNVAQPGEPYVISYWKLKYLIERHKPDTLILGFAHHNIAGFNDVKFINSRWSSIMFKRSYPIQKFMDQKDVRFNRLEFAKIYFREMFSKPHKDHFNFIGGYANTKTNKLTNVDKTIKRHYFTTKYPISEISISYLDSILIACQRNKITPILLAAPVHSSYFEKIPQSVKERFNALKRSIKLQNITVLDYSESAYNDSLFFNVDHINQFGAQKFSKEVIESFKKE